MQKMLITGIDGFVGYNAYNYFQNKNWQIFGVSKNNSLNIRNCFEIDLLNIHFLKQFIKKIKPDIILHLAAHVVLDRDFQVAHKCIDNNVKGTLNLLEVSKDIRIKKFLFFSTEEIYGDGPIPFKENQSTDPPSAYAISKIAAENFCLLYHKLYNLPVVVLRIATIYGLYQPLERFIPSIIIKSLKNEPIPFNSGHKKRDYLFIDDLIQAIERVILVKDTEGEIFNIGHQNSVSGKKLLKTIIQLCNSKSEILFDSFSDREGEADEWKMDNNKAKKFLNWSPETSLLEGLDKTIQFYKKSIS